VARLQGRGLAKRQAKGGQGSDPLAFSYLEEQNTNACSRNVPAQDAPKGRTLPGSRPPRKTYQRAPQGRGGAFWRASRGPQDARARGLARPGGKRLTKGSTKGPRGKGNAEGASAMARSKGKEAG